MKRSKTERPLASKRSLALAIGALALGISAIALFGSARSSQGAAPKAPSASASLTVGVVVPLPAAFARSIAASGTVAARDELLIGSDASGVRLLEVLVDVGSTVKKGQLLARADDAQLRAQLAQQEAQVKQAQAELLLAEANLERAERIKDSGVYSAEAVHTRRTTAQANRAKLELALAQRRELEVKIAQTRVVAPAGGIVARRTATVGAVVQPGAEMFRLIRDGQLEWLAELPGHSLARVRAGGKAHVFAGDGEPIEATVRMVAPTLDAASRNGLVYVTLPAGAGLKAGLHARGEILLDSVQALAVPEASIFTRDGYSFVYTVGTDEIARMTRIETGARQRGLVEVTGGLRGDARVVATGAGFVKDGELVRVAPEPARPVADRNTQIAGRGA